MKRTILAVCLSTSAALSAPVGSYMDAVSEGPIVTGNAHLDIISVDVSDSSSVLTFKINLVGNPTAVDWGKYIIAIDSESGGDTAGNGWGRPISMPSGMDYFIGSWVDGGNGAELRSWNGTSWDLQSATYNPNPDGLMVSKDTTSVTLSLNYAGMGMSPGSIFVFDVFSTGGGGGDSAIDALANPNQAAGDWSTPYSSSSTFSYMIVPEPSSLALLGLGAGAMLLARRRS